MRSLVLEAGPSVQTIFALLIAAKCALDPHGASSARGPNLFAQTGYGTLARMWGKSFPLWVALLSLVPGCAYPRRSTPISSLDHVSVRANDVPSGLFRLEIVSADVPETQRSGLPWDEDDAPDPFVKVFINGKPIWETATLSNTLHPEFGSSHPRNLAIERATARMRVELWDKDSVGNDPIGIYEGRALANAHVESDTTIPLEGSASLTFRVRLPSPHAGTGIASYEIRKEALLVLKVLPNSPASRADLRPGDRIVALGGRAISELGQQAAESGLALATQNRTELTVKRAEQLRTVTLDQGYIWLSM